MNPIEAIEQLFIGAWAHTVTLEYMEGEDQILITVEQAEGIYTQAECDWAADEDLGETIVKVLNRAMKL